MTPPSAQHDGPVRPPWIGFRVVFALANAILWAALTYAILTGVSFGLVAAGRLTPQAAAKTLRTTAGVVVFFVGFFGVPGALGALLSQARSGRFALPPVETRGRHSQLQHAWALGAGLGTLHALAIAALALGLGLDRDGTAGPSLLLSRAGVCAAWAGCAAACAFVQSLWIARPAALCDLNPPPEPPPTADTRYLLWRMALPQGVGNGVISALIAMATQSAGTQHVGTADLMIQAASTASIMALFMLTSAGGLAAADRDAGRVAAGTTRRPAWPLRAATLPISAAVAVGLAAIVGMAAGNPGLTGLQFALWQGLLGGGVAACTAALAARWTLGTEGATHGQDRPPR